jgi:hypothetical protein
MPYRRRRLEEGIELRLQRAKPPGPGQESIAFSSFDLLQVLSFCGMNETEDLGIMPYPPWSGFPPFYTSSSP